MPDQNLATESDGQPLYGAPKRKEVIVVADTMSKPRVQAINSSGHSTILLDESSYVPQYSLSLTLPLSLVQIPFTASSNQPMVTTIHSNTGQRDTVVRSAPAASDFSPIILTRTSQDTPEQSEIEELVTIVSKTGSNAEPQRSLKRVMNSAYPDAQKKQKVQSLCKEFDKPSTSSAKGTFEAEKKNPPCAICGDPATGIHFGADSCAACSAFFRRTVTINRKFECIGDSSTNCSNLKGSSSCKKCRFEKCVSVGMDIGSVQCNRDSIGHYSIRAKLLQNNNVSLADADTILDDLRENYNALNYRRQLLYSMENNIEKIFSEKEPPIREMKSVTDCLYQMKLLEPRLAADFVRSLQFLKDAELSNKDMLSLYKNFDVTRQAVEEPFLTYKHQLLERNCWVMLNRNYIDLSNTRRYFEDGTMNELTLGQRTAEK
ncbi:unnamed protein product [Strongylus vulgaris]|uniref:Nuclear receptor domain-containing protein n=1 Tax=Strongylus vulgaris TaxID=40348 RepID=A0A3P7LKS6_STRVU|nr:unnamed protein product [Strongylus vulgaris]